MLQGKNSGPIPRLTQHAPSASPAQAAQSVGTHRVRRKTSPLNSLGRVPVNALPFRFLHERCIVVREARALLSRALHGGSDRQINKAGRREREGEGEG